MVDDHPVVRAGLARVLERAGMTVVGQASGGEEGMRLAAQRSPDVILWDLAMPGGGVAAVGELRRVAPAARVLVITALDDPLLAREAARAGATGFLAKTAPADDLLAAVWACARGEPAFPDLPRLSPREEEVLALVGAGLSNQGIAGRLGISVKTVESHLERLKEKLDCATVAELRARAVRRTE